MDSLGQLQAIASAVLLVATIISTAVVGVLFGTNKTLRETVGDRGVRITDLEAEVTREKAEKDAGIEREKADREREVAREKAARAKAESEAAVLKSMVTGKVELIALGDLLDEHHRETNIHFTSIEGHLGEVPAKIVEALRQENL